MLWDLKNKTKPYAERVSIGWEDPGADNNKMSLVDLTGKTSKMPALANDGLHPGRSSCEDGQQTVNTTSASAETFSDISAQQGSSVAAQEKSGRESSSGDNSISSEHAVGYGGDPESDSSCDYEALAGRTGRKETCVVNAAIMKGSYPHSEGKLFSKPIVVDLLLPVWQENDDNNET